MKILIVAATAPEISSLLKQPFDGGTDTERIVEFNHKGTSLSLLVTGPGMIATSFFMSRVLAGGHYDLAINFGVAGSFDQEIRIGEAVHIISDQFAELGAATDSKFIPLYAMGMAQAYKPAFCSNEGLIVNTTYPKLDSVGKLRTASGITVNAVSGRDADIEALKARTNASIESMEGAAFFYACMMNQLPCMQIRTISNYVAQRENAAWNIEAAIESLKICADNILEELKQQQS